MVISLYEDVLGPLESPFYSFQNTIRDVVHPENTSFYSQANILYDRTIPLDTLLIFEGGCRVDDGWNCTAACLDPESGPQLVWNSENSTLTLHNCLILPFLVEALAHDFLRPNETALLTKYNLPSEIPASLGSQWPVINTCTEAWCKASGSENCSVTPTMGFESPFNIGDKSSFVNINNSLCSEIDISLNQDIGGLGVVISYIMQMTLLLAAAIPTLIGVFLNAAGIVDSGGGSYGDLYSAAAATRNKKSKLSKFKRSVCDFKRLLDTLVGGLGEFQSAQMFFVVTVQIAAHLALNRSSYYDATNWQQVQNNAYLLKVLTFGGIVSVVLGWATLQFAGNLSFFNALFSTLSVGLGMANWLRVSGTNTPPETTPSNLDIPECGGHILPTRYCFDGSQSTVLVNGSDYWMMCTIIVLLVLSIFALLGSLARRKSDEINGSEDGKRYKRLKCCRSGGCRQFQPCCDGLQVLAVLYVVSLNLYSLKNYTDQLRLVDENQGQWSLGQILAVGIWVPMVIRYVAIWLVKIGHINNVNSRLAKPMLEIEGPTVSIRVEEPARLVRSRL